MCVCIYIYICVFIQNVIFLYKQYVCMCVCVYIYIYIYNVYECIYLSISLVGRVFTNGLGDWGSIPKTQKMILDSSLLNTQHYKICIKGKLEQSKERSSALLYTLV